MFQLKARSIIAHHNRGEQIIKARSLLGTGLYSPMRPKLRHNSFKRTSGHADHTSVTATTINKRRLSWVKGQDCLGPTCLPRRTFLAGPAFALVDVRDLRCRRMSDHGCPSSLVGPIRTELFTPVEIAIHDYGGLDAFRSSDYCLLHVLA